MNLIYHITTRNASLEARQSGSYRTESLAAEGFIHFSQRHQVETVANAFYAGRSDLVILVVETSRLQAELKFEPPVHPSGAAPAAVPDSGDLFPHLYGPLNFDAVVSVLDFPPGPDARFHLPAALT